jgi:hypothetical protein
MGLVHYSRRDAVQGIGAYEAEPAPVGIERHGDEDSSIQKASLNEGQAARAAFIPAI